MERTIPISPLMKSKSDTSRRRAVWDCGSSLYDSFEVKSFEKQLHSAMAVSRTLSMSHLSDCRPSPRPKKPGAKVAGALQRLFRSVFRSKRDDGDNQNATLEERFVKAAAIPKERFYYVYYDKSVALSSIPEAPEVDGPSQPQSPGRRNLVRRTTSERVPARASYVGIY